MSNPFGEGLPRKRPKLKFEVVSDGLCVCGARFAQGEAAEFAKHVRGDCPVLVRLDELRDAAGRRLIAACGTTAGYQRHGHRGESPCEPCRAASREYSSKHRSDPEYRERLLERERERMRKHRSDPECRERINQKERERRADPEYRERKNQQQNERRRERYASDPEYAERERERQRERARKKRWEATG